MSWRIKLKKLAILKLKICGVISIKKACCKTFKII